MVSSSENHAIANESKASFVPAVALEEIISGLEQITKPGYNSHPLLDCFSRIEVEKGDWLALRVSHSSGPYPFLKL